eukprot:TRINITY_DN18259_c0_g1_i1.p1 TRINITY_DN18259_c0_g1~~TRINITY_DN18259_c0_g1_i1.p1  ORF type:complete len:181 (+),score=37.31 TRINITY_DN18259_c0_g1_i1:39-545(+)
MCIRDSNDIKQTFPDETVIYYFAEAQTTQTTIKNGPQIYLFSNNQLEFHHPDGSKEIKFPDGTEKYIHMNGEEETRLNDGTVQRITKDKLKIIEYPDGKKDTIYLDGSRLIQYPDGRVKRISTNQQITPDSITTQLNALFIFSLVQRADRSLSESCLLYTSPSPRDQA